MSPSSHATNSGPFGEAFKGFHHHRRDASCSALVTVRDKLMNDVEGGTLVLGESSRRERLDQLFA